MYKSNYVLFMKLSGTARHMPKLRNYNLVRDMWNTPTYINKYLSRTERAHIAKMYCGNLPLRVETGRYRNVPLNERLCTYCQLDEIEDDVHFIVRCPLLHTDLRLTLMANMHTDLDINLSAKDLFIFICFNAPPNALGQYIIKGMQRRRSTVLCPELYISTRHILCKCIIFKYPCLFFLCIPCA